MAFRDDTVALQARRERLEGELRDLETQIAQRKLAMDDHARAEDARFTWLRATHDPDLRVVRSHHSGDLIVFNVMFWGGALTIALFGHPGALGLGLLGFAVLQLAFVRTVVDRRTGCFEMRLPWSPWAYVARHTFGPTGPVVHRHVKTSKGNRTITFQVEGRDAIVADGMSEDDAHSLQRELGMFLAGQAGGDSGPAPHGELPPRANA